MVILIPSNSNPTRDDIDAFIHESRSPSSSSSEHRLTEITNIIREIRCKTGVGALLHPAEEYFLNAATTAHIIP
jgi:hypothetical protein